jgi:hypothetical protein
MDNPTADQIEHEMYYSWDADYRGQAQIMGLRVVFNHKIPPPYIHGLSGPVKAQNGK